MTAKEMRAIMKPLLKIVRTIIHCKPLVANSTALQLRCSYISTTADETKDAKEIEMVSRDFDKIS